MRWSSLLLGLLPFSLAQVPFIQTNEFLVPNAADQRIVGQYLSMEMHSRSAGTLPLRAIVKFVPSVNLEGGTHSIIVQQTNVESTIAGGDTTPGWTLFIPKLNELGMLANNVDLNTFGVLNPVVPLIAPPIMDFLGGFGANLADISFAPGWDTNYVTSNPPSELGRLAPRGRGCVSKDGKMMYIHLDSRGSLSAEILPFPVNVPVDPDLQPPTTVPLSNFGVPGTGNQLFAGVQYEMIIPQRYLSPNLEFPQQTVTTTLGFVRTRPLIFLSVTGLLAEQRQGLMTQLYLVPPLTVIAPFTLTVPELAISTLQLISAVPSSTVQSTQLESLVVTFILGIPVAAGGVVALEADKNIFGVINNQNLYITVGYNCDQEPELCCTRSLVRIRPQGNGPVTPVYVPVPGWSQLRISLGPKGCFLPKDKVIVLTISRAFLGRNPTIATGWNPAVIGSPLSLQDPTDAGDNIGLQNFLSLGNKNSPPFQFAVALPVNIRLYTSSEPHPVNVNRLGEPRHPYENAISLAPSQDVDLTVQIPFTQQGPNGELLIFLGGIVKTVIELLIRTLYFQGTAWSSYVVGASVVLSFRAVPETRITGVSPGAVTFSFVLSSVNIANSSAASPNGVVISANQGVIKPNIGRLDAPLPVAVIVSPSSCRTMWFYTNAYSTLIVMLNPLFDVRGVSDEAAACQAALVTNALITFIIPEDAFLPNLATGSNIYFDIRMVDPFADRSLLLFLQPGWRGPRSNSVDTATAMHQFGWQTVAACTAQIFGYRAGAATDLYAMTAEERCLLVNQMAAISPVTGGLLQCPSGAAAVNSDVLVSYIKVPEASFSGNHWPWSWVPNIQYPVLVSLPNTAIVAITNFGWIIDSPMFAVVVSYAPNVYSLRKLKISPSVPSTWKVLLIVRVDRMTESCRKLRNNPWAFKVTTASSIVQCLFFPSTGSNVNGIPVDDVSWSARNFLIPTDGVVVCWTGLAVSPKPDDGSDEALLGLLALIAIPVLLLCCLLALLWFLRPKREPPCCVPEAPIQETYWVAAEPACMYAVNPTPCSAGAAFYPAC